MLKKKTNLPAEKLRKPHGVLVKFKTMEDILLGNAYWFDNYGNLHVSKHGACLNSEVTLAPMYFCYLGKTRKFDKEVHFDSVFIEKEWADIFEPNNALRHIASGRFDKEDCVKIAREGVVIP